jgi:hypothetical protein
LGAVHNTPDPTGYYFCLKIPPKSPPDSDNRSLDASRAFRYGVHKTCSFLNTLPLLAGVCISTRWPPKAIFNVLRQPGDRLTPKQIRDRLKSEGYPMERFGKDCVYLYNVLKRPVDRRAIKRIGKVYYVDSETEDKVKETA